MKIIVAMQYIFSTHLFFKRKRFRILSTTGTCLTPWWISTTRTKSYQEVKEIILLCLVLEGISIENDLILKYLWDTMVGVDNKG